MWTLSLVLYNKFRERRLERRWIWVCQVSETSHGKYDGTEMNEKAYDNNEHEEGRTFSADEEQAKFLRSQCIFLVCQVFYFLPQDV